MSNKYLVVVTPTKGRTYVIGLPNDMTKKEAQRTASEWIGRIGVESVDIVQRIQTVNRPVDKPTQQGTMVTVQTTSP